MALHWYAVNLDRCEAVDPKRMGEPATWAGWVNDGPEGTEPSETYADGRVSLTRRWVHSLIAFGHWKYEDEIRLVSTAMDGGPAGSVAWLGRNTARAADYLGPEWASSPAVWSDAPHPSTLKAPAPTLVPADEEPLVMPADASAEYVVPGDIENINARAAYYQPKPEPIPTRGMLGVPMVGDHSPPQRLHTEYLVSEDMLKDIRKPSPRIDDEPPASVEELLASHPGPWRIEPGNDGALVVLDPLGQTVAAFVSGADMAAAQLLVRARELPFYTPTSGADGGR